MQFVRTAVVLAAALVVLPVSSGFAEGLSPGPYEAGLDASLKAHDVSALGRALLPEKADADTTARATAWLKRQEIRHGSASIAMLYAAVLWRNAQEAQDPHLKTRLSHEAGVRYFLARMLISTEGFQCKDASAVTAANAAVEQQAGPAGRYAEALPEAQRLALMDEAFETMVATFVMRENDVWMCEQGGAPGKTGAAAAPDFVPYADWGARRRQRIDAIVALLGVKPPSAGADNAHLMK